MYNESHELYKILIAKFIHGSDIFTEASEAVENEKPAEELPEINQLEAENLKRLIDKALQEGDKERFIQYSNQLRENSDMKK
ncbi:IDEAL domain-containing protein [Jeotgalibacillus terrae]|uniref:IDEAL domain-containing protein n=1 Tax=Jeotgalibacillus terrae TaxID=587735 RepID=A0ABW5ZFM3_9BACL|nr:IDEAL domain-containing protein [Jeotgalibacillus terrae]MBM7580038.1 uncharacterized protein YpiB (UPF0302 family) [Jeotgalibacillus terrae]